MAESTTIHPYSLKSVSQIISAVKTCRDKNWTPFFIGNELIQDDVFISELGLVFGSWYIKTPAPVSSPKLEIVDYIGKAGFMSDYGF